MRRNTHRLLAALASALLASGVATAQRPAQPKPKPRESKASDATKTTETADAFEQQLRVRALDALRATGEEARQWKDAAAAARAQSQIADLVWEVDSDAARVQLVRAWESAARVEERDASAGMRFRSVSPRTAVRQQVLLVARRRDRALAARWLEQMASELDAAKSSQPRGTFDDRTPRSTVLLEMAMANVAANPKAAAELATESLRDGVSFGFQNVLIAIQEKDFPLAATVFRAALARLRASGLVDPNEVFVLSSYLYTPGRIIGANTSEHRGNFPLAVSANAPTIKAAAQLDPALSTEFLQTAADALLAMPLPSTATTNATEMARAQLFPTLMIANRLPPQMSDLAMRLRERAQQLEVDSQFTNAPRAETPEMPSPHPGESAKDYMARRIDLMEEAARKETDPLARDIAYAKAALATNEEGYERGYATAQNIKDEELRQGISDWLTYAATLAAVKANDLDRAATLTKRNGEPVERAASYVVGARKLLAAKDTVRAGEWLTEAAAALKSADADEQAVRAAFGVAATYAQFDRLLALQTLGAAVKIANRSAGPGDLEDERAPLVKRFAGLDVQTPTMGTSGFGLKAAAAAFGAEQFDEALATLRGLASAEARGVAIVALCREVLQRPRAAPQKTS